MASPEAVMLLREIRDELRAIRVAIETRSVAPKRKKRPRTLLDDLRRLDVLDTTEKHAVAEVARLWAETCPDCPQPVGWTADRRREAIDLWKSMGGAEGVTALFLTIAHNDWLSGRLLRDKGIQRRNGVGLFEAIRHRHEIVEGTYR